MVIILLNTQDLNVKLAFLKLKFLNLISFSQVGTNNMVHLTPEDFTASVMRFNQEDKASLSKIRKIQQMLNENPENPDIGNYLVY